MDEIFNSNAEVAILSILIKHPELVYDTDDINENIFSTTPNKVLFSTIKELSRQDLVPEKHLLVSYLETNGKLELAGSVEYIEYLSNQTYSEENFTEFKRLATKAYKAKHILSLSAQIPDILKYSGGDVDEVINQVRDKIEALNDISTGDTAIEISNYLDDAWNALSKRVENPGLVGIPYGFSSIDNVTGGMVGGDLIILGARPSMGKSAFVLSSVLEEARKGFRPLLFSLEMNKQQLIDRLIAIIAGIELTKIRQGTLQEEEIDKIKDAFKELAELPIFIDTNFTGSSDYIFSTIRRFNNQKGITNVWIDYVQLLAERSQNSTHELGQISRGAKLLAGQLDMPIGIVAQLNRLVEGRDDKRPILSDLRQSGNLEEDADLVAFLYRDEYYYRDTKDNNVVEFIIRKNRQGPIGTVRLKFDKYTAKIYDGK